jgi:paraquat-inducible protein A
MVTRNEFVCCSWCDQTHRAVALRAGERALCVQCGKTLAKGSVWGPHASLALSAAALAFAVPAVLLPFVTLSKFGNARKSGLLDAAGGLWHAGMPPLAAVVLFCGMVAPLLLLAFLLVSRRIKHDGAKTGRWTKVVHLLQHWAMPEVHVLAVLVAFVKLGSLVAVEVGPGLWCYGAMSFAMLAALRSFELDPPGGSAPAPLHVMNTEAKS